MTIAECSSPEFRPVGMPMRNLSPFLLTNTTDLGLGGTNVMAYMIGQIWWEGGGSHTVDNTGLSAIGWYNGNGTFNNAGTSFKVGIAAVDTSNGPNGRPVNSTGVPTLDVAAVLTGGGGGVTNNAWNETVPTTGTKTIANGELVAVCMYMATRGGSDNVQVRGISTNNAFNAAMPQVGIYNAGFSGQNLFTNCAIRASDGARGYFIGGQVSAASSSQTWNNTSGTKEFANIIQLPYSCKAYGAIYVAGVGAPFDLVLYSDPFGTPTSQAFVSVDENTVFSSGTTSSAAIFTTGFGYSLAANTPYAIAMKPTSASNMTLQYFSFGVAGHQTSVPCGDNGYAVSRNTGAFSAQNSQKDRFWLGLLVGGGDTGGSGAGAMIGC
ncbi:hypothetical protein [Bradyrhizobium elkanii]|uniref:hypothetical protein n=1 Tax=Bradyrhizobium elkanii TaxID=29448 RepID=UPI001448BCF6|nr:hypothetical protein [Bradyrhizobium elkanii]MCS3577760.1 hypothetical protein [Bradyrhizobium elkanii]MCS3720635.1 hypothetical protein [Bradyrhizobium elkanii]MCS4005052.1 hypothetical protein [Bradyrhizobium elkanii USDA 61]MCW2130322.1 hypothetical protein [Bradyrhizobium elkanii]MCW2167998.1 hypothetical protein [Bradyrhizobium elkanii]